MDATFTSPNVQRRNLGKSLIAAAAVILGLYLAWPHIPFPDPMDDGLCEDPGPTLYATRTVTSDAFFCVHDTTGGQEIWQFKSPGGGQITGTTP